MGATVLQLLCCCRWVSWLLAMLLYNCFTSAVVHNPHVQVANAGPQVVSRPWAWHYGASTPSLHCAAPEPVAKKRKRQKIRIGGPTAGSAGARVVFDEDGNALDPLALVAAHSADRCVAHYAVQHASFAHSC
jgi:hypothetical protein